MATTTETKSVFVVRESFGTYGMVGPAPFKQWDGLQKAAEETRFTTLSQDGKYFAIGRVSHVDIVKTKDGSRIWTIDHGILLVQFSPLNRFLICLDDPGKGTENYNIWSIEREGQPGSRGKGAPPKLVFSQHVLKQPEAQFSWNDRILGRLSSDGRILFYGTDNFYNEVCGTPNDMKIATFSFSPGHGGGGRAIDDRYDEFPYVCFVKGYKQQQPTYIRLYKYPDVSTPITQRSSFQADRVYFKWNRTGTAVLVITTSGVDKTGGSYSRKKTLEFLDVTGHGFRVRMDGIAGDTELHACEWSPNSHEFCVIMGALPHTHAALFTLKGEMLFNFNMDVEIRNHIYFNPQGNIILLCGFFDLPASGIEIWEVKEYKECIKKIKVSTLTQVEWLNDGAHFITATTAPEVEFNNGFTVWNSLGEKVFEWRAKKLLFGITSFAAHEQERTFPDDKLAKHFSPEEDTALKGGDSVSAYIPTSKGSESISTSDLMQVLKSIDEKIEAGFDAMENKLEKCQEQIEELHVKTECQELKIDLLQKQNARLTDELRKNHN